MALIWMDGFDHYGAGANGRLAMLDGVWSELFATTTPEVTAPRTGLYAFGRSAAAAGMVHRRILGAAKTTVGLGMAFRLASMPTANNRLFPFVYRDTANAAQVTIVLQSTGKISAYRGDVVTLLGESADGVVTAGAYQHIECKVVFNDTTGAIEVRVNGVTVLNLSGIDTVQTANVECSQVCFMNSSGVTSGAGAFWFDDVFAWDDAGSRNNDFLGDRRVRAIFPDADTATEEWTATGATDGFDCINDAAPDDETTYISALPLTGSPPTPLTSVYGLQDPPAGVGSIAAVQTCIRMRKTEAGDTNVQVSLLSSGDESAGSDRPITEIYTYWSDVHELNPNTGTPWSESSLSAAQLQIKRTV